MRLDKVLNGRVATQADVDAGTCVFYIPESRSKPYVFQHELPLRARVIGPDGDSGFGPIGTEVVVVQAEVGDNGEVVVGVLLDDEGEGICTLAELEIIGPISD